MTIIFMMNRMKDQKVLVDSDAMIAIRFVDQSTHLRAVQILRKLKKQNAQIYCLNLCLQETATVISRKYSQEKAIEFKKDLKKSFLNIIELDQTLEQSAWDIFVKQTKKCTSFIDCANLAALQFLKFDKIFSFDQFYPKEMLLI